MSFLCNFPLYSKNATLETDTLFSISLPTKRKKTESSTTTKSIPTYSNEKEIKFNEEEQKKVIYKPRLLN